MCVFARCVPVAKLFFPTCSDAVIILFGRLRLRGRVKVTCVAMFRVSKLLASNINTNYFDHVAAHTGVKRNMCVMCKKRFTYSRDLRAHVSRCHPK